MCKCVVWPVLVCEGRGEGVLFNERVCNLILLLCFVLLITVMWLISVRLGAGRDESCVASESESQRVLLQSFAHTHVV